MVFALSSSRFERILPLKCTVCPRRKDETATDVALISFEDIDFIITSLLFFLPLSAE